ncbi:tudor domain-containing protein 1 [Anomaloglossus baeobatrachus]|uniref:tudor domain-containing protein 1 n=1 Tax=Anomaloglossus baeobatrachus TaxID=238106 RepID=UPI003F500EF6
MAQRSRYSGDCAVEARNTDTTTPGKERKLRSPLQSLLSLDNDPKLFGTINQVARATTCHYCGLSGSRRCSRCLQTYYCSVECQRQDWKIHTVICRPATPKEMEGNNCLNGEDPVSRGSTPTAAAQTADHQHEEATDRKILLCDLQKEALSEGTELQGYVVEFSSPSNFFVKAFDAKSMNNLMKVSSSLQNLYSDPSTMKKGYTPEPGEVCVAKYHQDQQWYRALMYNVETTMRTAQVLYLDYGNTETLSLDSVQPMHRDVELLPPCALHCSLAHVAAPPFGWTPECLVDVKRLLVGHKLLVRVTAVVLGELPHYSVHVSSPDSGEEVHKIMIEKGYSFPPLTTDHEKGGDPEKVPELMEQTQMLELMDATQMPELMPQNDCQDGAAHKPELLSSSLAVGDRFEILVTVIHDPGMFFCQKVQNAKQLEEVMEKMRHCYSTSLPSPQFSPAPGEICAAQFSEDNAWYRASVVRYISTESVLVGYLDFGNTETLATSRLRCIAPELLSVPFQAAQCCLAGVKSVSGKWSSEATDSFRVLVVNKILSASIVANSEGVLTLELTDESVTPNLSVSQHLIKARLAAPSAADCETPAEEAAAAGGDRAVPLRWAQLPPGVETEVLVSTLHNPGDFCCHRRTDLHLLNRLNEALGEYCSQNTSEGHRPARDETCAAYYTGDGHWYRAQVQDHRHGHAAKILYVDYGNTEDVSTDKLCKIPSSFLQLPMQAISCSLSGVRPDGQDWSEDAVKTFQKSVVGVNLLAKAVQRTKRGFSVELVATDSGTAISDLLLDAKCAVRDEPSVKEKMEVTDIQAARPRRDPLLKSPPTSIPVQEGVTPPQSTSIPARGGATPPESTSIFDRGGMRPPESTSIRARGGATPPQSTSIPARGGATPPESTSIFARGALRPPESTSIRAPGGMRPPESTFIPVRGGATPPESTFIRAPGGMRPSESTFIPARGGATPPESGPGERSRSLGSGDPMPARSAFSKAPKHLPSPNAALGDLIADPAAGRSLRSPNVAPFGLKDMRYPKSIPSTVRCPDLFTHRAPNRSPNGSESTKPFPKVCDRNASSSPTRGLSAKPNTMAFRPSDNFTPACKELAPGALSQSAQKGALQAKPIPTASREPSVTIPASGTPNKSPTPIPGDSRSFVSPSPAEHLILQAASAVDPSSPNSPKSAPSTSGESQIRSSSPASLSEATPKSGENPTPPSPSKEKQNLNDKALDGNPAAGRDLPGVHTAQRWIPVGLPVNTAVPACVLAVISPDLFYVFPKENRVDVKGLQQVMLEIHQYCSTETGPHNYRPAAGDVCCAKFTEDGQWYRAVVLEVQDSSARIVYADYGNMEDRPFSCLLPMKKSFLELPMQLTRCSLADVLPVAESWSPLATRTLTSLLVGAEVVVTASSLNAGIYSVRVDKPLESGALHVAEQLVMDGLARSAAVTSSGCPEGRGGCRCRELLKRREESVGPTEREESVGPTEREESVGPTERREESVGPTEREESVGADGAGRVRGADGAGRVRGADGAGRVRGADGAGRVRGADGAGRVRGADGAGRVRGGRRSGKSPWGRRSGKSPWGRRSGKSPWGRRSGKSPWGRRSGKSPWGRRSGKSPWGRRSGKSPWGRRSGKSPWGRRSGKSPWGRRSGEESVGPTEREESVGPTEREESVGPTEREESVGPTEREESVGPTEREESVGPTEREESVGPTEREESVGPTEREESVGPTEREESVGPTEREESVGPTEREESVGPTEREESVGPTEREESVGPTEREESVGPTEREESVGADGAGRVRGADGAGRVRGADGAGRVRGADGAGRVRGADGAGRVRGADGAGRVRGGRRSGKSPWGRRSGKSPWGRRSGKSPWGRRSGKSPWGRRSGKSPWGRRSGKSPWGRRSGKSPWGPTEREESVGPTEREESVGPTEREESVGPTEREESVGPTEREESVGPTEREESVGPTEREESVGPTEREESVGPTEREESVGPTEREESVGPTEREESVGPTEREESVGPTEREESVGPTEREESVGPTEREESVGPTEREESVGPTEREESVGPTEREESVGPTEREESVGPTEREESVGPTEREESVGPTEREESVGPTEREESVGPTEREESVGPTEREESVGPTEREESVGPTEREESVGPTGAGKSPWGRRSGKSPWGRRSGKSPWGRRSGKSPWGRRSGKSPGGRRSGKSPGGRRSGKSPGGPTEREESGGPTEREESGGPTEREESGGPTEREESGGPTEREESGGPTEREESGGPTEREESGGPTEREESGGPTEREESGGAARHFPPDLRVE